MKEVIGFLMLIMGVLLMAVAVMQRGMMDQALYQYVFFNTDQLDLIVALGLGLCFTPVIAEMI